MLKRSFNWWNQSALTLTPYEEAIRRFKAVVVPGVDVYRDIRSIETVFPTIDLYLEEIERIIKCLENDIFIFFILNSLTSSNIWVHSNYHFIRNLFQDLF